MQKCSLGDSECRKMPKTMVIGQFMIMRKNIKITNDYVSIPNCVSGDKSNLLDILRGLTLNEVMLLVRGHIRSLGKSSFLNIYLHI